METIGHFTHFAFSTSRRFPGALLRPRATLGQIARFVAGSLAMVLAVGLAIGLVTWMHLGEVLARYESTRYLPSSLMVAVVLELGPVSVGLIAASRIAAGLAAELAAMEASEQIDALRCIGVSPLERLVAPRVLACVLTLPPLTVLVDYGALVGSYSAEWLAGDLTWPLYWRRALDELTLTGAALSTAKTAVFGLLVGLISCFIGLRAERGAQAVGSAATRAVVASTLAVLVSDVLMVRLIQLVE